MLDLSLDGVSLERGGLSIAGLSATFPRSSHTALIGPSGCGKSTLLALLEGTLRPSDGRVVIGQRDATRMRPSSRPVFHSARTEPIPGRWSVRHVLIAAARSRRSLDYEDRVEEIARVSAVWGLEPLLDRRVRELSSGEALRVRLAQILILRPAVLIAERLFATATAGTVDELEDRFWRQLRTDGGTVVHEIARPDELGWADRAVLLDAGVVAGSGSPRDLERTAPTAALAALFGPVSAIPLLIDGNQVRAAIGEWRIETPPFQGNGVALAHPWHFTRTEPGEESDFIFGIDEARFLGWTWELTGIVSGATLLRVWVDAAEHPTKGRLLPLRFDPSRFRLFPAGEIPRLSAPTDAIPSQSSTR